MSDTTSGTPSSFSSSDTSARDDALSASARTVASRPDVPVASAPSAERDTPVSAPVALRDAAPIQAPAVAVPAVAEQPWHGNLPAIVPQKMPVDIAPSTLTPEQRAAAEAEARRMDLSSTQAILTFGAAPQQRLNQYLDELLRGDTLGSAGAASEIVAELSRGMSRLNLRQMRAETQGKGIRAWLADKFSGSPFIGRHVSAIRAFLMDRASLVGEFEKIEEKGRAEKTRLFAQMERTDALVRETESVVQDFKAWLVAGTIVRDREVAAYEAARSRFQSLPAAERDPTVAARIRDQGENIAKFEVRLVRMHAAFLENIQKVVEIRNLGKGAEIEAQNVMESLLGDVPRMKRAVVQMVALHDLKKAREGNEARKRLSMELDRMASEGTAQAYLQAKESQGDFQSELDHLESAAKLLTATLEWAAEIDKANRQKREEARRRIASMKDSFVADITEMQRSV